MKNKVPTIHGLRFTPNSIVSAVDKLCESPIKDRETFDLLVHVSAVFHFMLKNAPATFNYAVNEANKCMEAAEIFYRNQFKKGGAK